MELNDMKTMTAVRRFHPPAWRQTLWALLLFWPSLAAMAVTLPFTDGFESGDFRAWTTGQTPGFIVTSPGDSSQYAARGTNTLGAGISYYQEAVFGDHPRARGVAVTNGLWVKFAHKFDAGFTLGSTFAYHKTLLINFEDSSDRRREQIILNVFGISRYGSLGEYLIENIHWNEDGSFGRGQLFTQNIGAPVAYRSNQWDTIKIFIRPNTVGLSDGVVRVWVNGTLKIEHVNVSIRLTGTNPNLVIVGYHAPATDIQGTRWWDNVTISETDPDTTSARVPRPPAQLRAQ